MVGVGLSLGGNLLARVAADMPDFPLQAIALMCAPYDLGMCTNLMRNKVYEKYLLKGLLKETISRQPISEAEEKILKDIHTKFNLNADAISKMCSWEQYEMEVLIKCMPDFGSVAQFQYDSSCLLKIRKGIKVPTLALNARDDPIIPQDSFPLSELKGN